MILLKSDPPTEAGAMPSEELLAAMTNFNEELVNAGVMLAGEGLHPSSKGARVRFSLTPEFRKREERQRARIAKKRS